MGLDYLPRYRETEAEARARAGGIASEETLEDAVQFIGRDAAAVVLVGEEDVPRPAGFRLEAGDRKGDGNRFLARMTQGVVYEVLRDPPELQRVREDEERIGIRCDLQADVGKQGLVGPVREPQVLDRVAEEGAKVDPPELGRRGLGLQSG